MTKHPLDRPVAPSVIDIAADDVRISPETADVVDEIELIGRFEYRTAEDLWAWSAGMYSIHGYDAHEVLPTSAFLLAHKHPDDRELWATSLAIALKSGQPFCIRHRIIDAKQRVRSIVVAGEGIMSEDGEPGSVIGIHGYFIDITTTMLQAASKYLNDNLQDTLAHRIAIEQAKGVLMATYSVTVEEAFAILTWHSQNSNIKLRSLAVTLMDRLQASASQTVSPREKVEAVLVDLTGATTRLPYLGRATQPR